MTASPDLRSKGGRSRLWRYPRATVGLGIIGALLLFTVVGPFVWPVSPLDQDLVNSFAPPSLDHPLGLDPFGRDVFSRLMHGGRLSLFLGVASVLVGFLMGFSLGIIAATGRRFVELSIMRAVDALLALPGMILAIAFVAAFGTGVGPLIIALSFYSLPIFARVAYTAGQQAAAEDYVQASRATGAHYFRILLRHVAPNAVTPVLTIATIRIGASIVTAAGLNFFGLGVQPPVPEWGLMIAESATYSYQHPIALLIPALALTLTVVAFNLLGDGIRDALDRRGGSRK